MSYPGADFDATTAQFLAPADYTNPTPARRYHLVVIGAGPAGLISAIGAAGLGARVALVERQRMGGDCLNVGCVPSKALLEYTRHHSSPDFDGAFAWLREVRADIAPHDSVERYTSAGVDVFLGDAGLTPDCDVRVGDALLRARRVAICTGARAALPPIPGLAESQPLTNETLFDLTERPASIGILGAGAIGCEIATVFARLGTEVHLFELADRIMPLEDPDASTVVAAALVDLGVHLHLGAGVSQIRRGVTYEVHAGDVQIDVAAMLVALGRRPNTDGMGLAEAGVEVDEQGFIVTDNKLRTANKRVYAAGDCTSRLQFTHHADAHARAIVQNTLFAPTAKIEGLVVPHCTYTQPEVASVGPTRQALEAAGTAFDTYEFDFTELDRGRAEIDGDGFARVHTKKGSDEILAATIVGHDAGEQIGAICLLMSNGLGLAAAGRALYSYPTRSEYLKRLADGYNRSRLTPTVARLFKSWLALTR